MSKVWCECDKCHGGKFVHRATWYRHKKWTDTPKEYSSSAGRILARRRNLSSNVVPRASVNLDVNESRQADSPDIKKFSPRSDPVSVLSQYNLSANPSQGKDMDDVPGRQNSLQTSQPPTPRAFVETGTIPKGSVIGSNRPALRITRLS
jgi:hypothetical protein